MSGIRAIRVIRGCLKSLSLSQILTGRDSAASALKVLDRERPDGERAGTKLERPAGELRRLLADRGLSGVWPAGLPARWRGPLRGLFGPGPRRRAEGQESDVDREEEPVAGGGVKRRGRG